MSGNHPIQDDGPDTMTNTQVFVMQNGHYTNTAIPQAPPSYRGGYGATGRNMFRAAYPPDLKRTKVVKNPANLKKDSVGVEFNSLQPNMLMPYFSVDSECDAELTIHYAITESQETEDSMPIWHEAPKSLQPQADSMDSEHISSSSSTRRNSREGKSPALVSAPVWRQRIGPGLDQNFKLPMTAAIDLRRLDEDLWTYDQNKNVSDGCQLYPMLVVLRPHQSGMVKAQYTYISLVRGNGGWRKKSSRKSCQNHIR